MSPICQKTLKEVLHYDPITGHFTWIKKIADKITVGQLAGYENPAGYRFIRIFGKRYRAHHLAFLYMLGRFPVGCVDHINHIPSDNSWANLREVTQKENCRNQHKTRRNKTGFVGVSQRPDGKFVARIYTNKRHKFLGAFESFEQAVIARKNANVKYNFHQNHGA